MKLATALLGILLFATTGFSQFDTSRVYAHLAVGGGYEAVLLLTNKTSSTWDGHLRVRQGNNVLWSGSLTVNNAAFPTSGELPLQIAPQATSKITLRGDQTVRVGYLELHSVAGAVTANLTTAYFYYFRSADGVIRTTAGSPESIASSRFVFGVERSATVDTGFAWAPSTSAQAVPAFPITLTLYDSNGAQIQTRTVAFGGHAAAFFSQVFTGVPATFVGHIVVEMPLTSLIYLTVLRQETTPGGGFQLTSTPPDSLPPLVLPSGSH